MTRFVDLPVECIHTIYDMLNVHDRINLNQALPRHLTIQNTLQTSKINNDKLVLISKSLKRRKCNKISGKLLEYIHDNQNDPTIAELILKYDINASQSLSCTQICDRIKNNYIVQIDEISSELKDYELNEITTYIVEYGSVEQYDIMTNHSSIMHCITRDGYLTLPILYENTNLIKHLINNGQELYNLDIAAEIEKIFAYLSIGIRRKEYRDTIIEHIPLNATQYELLLDVIDDDMDIESAKLIYSRLL